jgi:hypothetical protein
MLTSIAEINDLILGSATGVSGGCTGWSGRHLDMVWVAVFFAPKNDRGERVSWIPIISRKLEQKNKKKEVSSAMWAEATRVAAIGFSGVFATLVILAVSVKVMSFFCKRIEGKGGKKK